MIEKAILSFTREQLIGLVNDESVPILTLRMVVCAALGGNAATLQELAAASGEAPATGNGKQAKAPKGVATTNPGFPAAPKPAAASQALDGNGGNPADRAVVGFIDAQVGFAVSDVVAAAGCTTTVAAGAIRRAVKHGKLHMAGERRFSRYAPTKALAAKASNEAKAAASGPKS